MNNERFLALYDPVHDQFTRYCLAMTGNEQDAKDLINDAILRALERFETLRNPDSFLYFLISIAKRVYLNQRRRTKFWGQVSESKMEGYQDPSANQETNIEAWLLYKALDKLPTKQKEALILFEITGFSLKEVAEIQGNSLSAVKVRLMRGRKKLAELLRDSESEFVNKKSVKGQFLLTH